MSNQNYAWRSIYSSKTEIKEPYIYLKIYEKTPLIATKITLTIKNVIHLTIGIKCLA